MISVVWVVGLLPPKIITFGLYPFAGVSGRSTELPYVLLPLYMVVAEFVHVAVEGSKILEECGFWYPSSKWRHCDAWGRPITRKELYPEVANLSRCSALHSFIKAGLRSFVYRGRGVEKMAFRIAMIARGIVNIRTEVRELTR